MEQHQRLQSVHCHNGQAPGSHIAPCSGTSTLRFQSTHSTADGLLQRRPAAVPCSQIAPCSGASTQVPKSALRQTSCIGLLQQHSVPPPRLQSVRCTLQLHQSANCTAAPAPRLQSAHCNRHLGVASAAEPVPRLQSANIGNSSYCT